MAVYMGNTEEGLLQTGGVNRALASVAPRLMLPYRGSVTLEGDHLVLGGWRKVAREQIKEVSLRFTGAFSRWQSGGIGPPGPNLSFFVRGEPLVLELVDGERLYLLIERHPVTGMTRNREWHKAITEWLGR